MPHLHPDEQVVRRFDHHWIRFVGPVLTFVLLTAVLATIAFFAIEQRWVGEGLILVIVGTVFLCGVHALFRFLFSEALEVGYITQYRFVHFEVRLFAQNDVMEIPFDTNKNVVGKKRGILANILDYGDLTFTTMDTTIETVPHPDRLAELVQELITRV